jgi:hypothetical protein
MVGSNQRIYVAGHKGLVGSAIVRALETGPQIIARSHEELNLTDQVAVVGIKDPRANHSMSLFGLASGRMPARMFGSYFGAPLCCSDVKAGRSITSASTGYISPKALI